MQTTIFIFKTTDKHMAEGEQIGTDFSCFLVICRRSTNTNWTTEKQIETKEKL